MKPSILSLLMCLLLLSIGDEVEAQLGPRLLGNLNVDNRFEAYISTDDSEQGTLLASGGNWQTTYTLASSLLDGQEYYLHIKATDTGGATGFLGDFELTDTSHRFSNGLTTLNTNTVNWSVSTSGWSNYELASAFGVNGVNPWKAQSGVNASAQWIWSSDNSADNTAYFSTKIVAATRVPVLEYRFDELSWTGSANEVIDSSGNNYNGTAIGGITTATGKICHAAEVPNNNSASIFEAVDTGVDLDTVIGSSGTISLWYKGDSDWNSGTDKRLFDATDGDKYFFAEIRSDGRVRFFFEDGNDGYYQRATDNAFSVGAGVWKHLTFVWDVTNITTKIFVDGVEQSLSGGTGGTTALSGLGTLYFGDNRDASYTPGQSSASGLIDEALVFDSVLTTTQIQAIFTNQNAGNNYDGTARTCPTPDVNHYRIEHDTQGFTCEAEAMTIKACANEDCSDPYTDPVSITLSPSGWSGGNTITFENDQGGLTKTLSVTNAGSITLTKTIAIPNADLRCFNGSTEISCEIEFVNAGFEFFGTTTAIKTLGDQAAETNFSNVNIRAVRDDAGVCKALLKDSKDITFIYNCEGPATCLTPLAGIPLNGVPSGDQSGTLSVTFAADGTAPLSMLNYADVGRLNLTVLGEIDGVTLTSGSATIDVYPTNLKLDVSPVSLTDSGSNFTAGKPFDFTIGAYGAMGSLLKNYQAGTLELKVQRTAPTSSDADEGDFKYNVSNLMSSSLSPTFTSTASLTFSGGKYTYADAYYDEVGNIELDIRDTDYLGNVIASQGSISLGTFIPAYFDVAVSGTPTLADTCGVFSYIGETIGFDTAPELTITAYNALAQITDNYSDSFWNYQPNESALGSNLSYIDKSSYTSTGTASVIDLGDTPVITNNNNYDGSGTVTINNGRFRYNKVNPVDNSVFGPVSAFTASIDMAFSSALLTDEDGVCYKVNVDGTCLPLTISNITGANMRYGRLTLESTYGPETEPLNVPIKAEYFSNNQWLLNTDDSNCTSIALTETAGQIILTAIDGYDLDLVGKVKSVGGLISGVPVGDQFKLKAPDPSQLGPGTQGQLALSLDPTAIGVEWPNHLNYDWNADGFIDADDHPEATVTFGLFRGNDRIIQWRELFD